MPSSDQEREVEPPKPGESAIHLQEREVAESVYKKIEPLLSTLEKYQEIEVSVTEEERVAFNKAMPRRANPLTHLGAMVRGARGFAPLDLGGATFTLERDGDRVVLTRAL